MLSNNIILYACVTYIVASNALSECNVIQGLLNRNCSTEWPSL